MSVSGTGSDPGAMVSGSGSNSDTGSTETTGSGGGSQTMLANGSWLAGLAMGDSTKTVSPSALCSLIVAYVTLSLSLSFVFF